MFPTADEFHDDLDPKRNARFRDEFGGIVTFPFSDTELSLLSVHPSLVDLATQLLATDDIRVYSIEAWGQVHRSRRRRTGTSPRLPQPHTPRAVDR